MAAKKTKPVVAPTPNSGVFSVMKADGSVDARRDPKLSTAAARHLYETMVRTRVLDERMTMLQRQGRIGFHIGSMGEEATIVGSAAGLDAGDFIFPCYREIGAALYRGFSLETYMHNMFGTAGDTVKGRQMPDHYSAREIGFGSVSSPVGTQIPQAVGYAWAARHKGEKSVALVYFGEGATSEGDFHVGLNFAGVMKAPVIFLCRNNHWAISVPVARQTRSENIAVKAEAYGIRGVQVDGNDALAVVAATREAAERGRHGEGATLIECLTYRVGAHSTSDDPRVYRADEEVVPWRAQDGIDRMRRYLERRGIWKPSDEETVRTKADDAVKAAIKTAEATAEPDLETIFEGVFAEQPWHLREEWDEAARARDLK